ncbi:hypothetical protein HELRODRAFT_177484 [Helobdella robusta]|uniref:Methyltransferase small domain-containing protein n=1 Tax=Helobdella robusta TaxID=6412 RepID=T1FBR8_HELRO|nr:hypothetical protein HELRODRAFT_177484 [Helobdella robusta]ESN97848.1 hypothetical protein HELRODRAFT_177484 [Helobdella robusta]
MEGCFFPKAGDQGRGISRKVRKISKKSWRYFFEKLTNGGGNSIKNYVDDWREGFSPQALSCYLSENPAICQRKKILELGSGTGLTGLLAAKLSDDPSKVFLTDNNDHVLELLQKNIESNFENSCYKPVCSNLSWGKDHLKTFTDKHGSDFNMLLGADVVYWPASVSLFIETVQHFLKNLKLELLLVGSSTWDVFLAV